MDERGGRQREPATHLRPELRRQHDGVEGRAERGDVAAELRLYRRDRRKSVGLGEFDGQAGRELHLDEKPNQRLVVRQDLCAGLQELSVDQPDVAMDEDVFPGHEDIAEDDEIVGLVESRRQGIVEPVGRDGGVRSARIEAQSLCIQRHHHRDRVVLIAGLERGDVAQEQVVRDGR